MYATKSVIEFATITEDGEIVRSLGSDGEFKASVYKPVRDNLANAVSHAQRHGFAFMRQVNHYADGSRTEFPFVPTVD